MASILVTGGTENLGLEVVQYFAPTSLGVSRRNGFDIRTEEGRFKIVQESLKYDIFLNHAYARDSSQQILLQNVFDSWVNKKKIGYIISTGTFGTTFSEGIDPTYINQKKLLDEISRNLSLRVTAECLPFRVALIRPGMLDTPRSRAKAHWRGNGVRGADFARIIECMYGLPKDLSIFDMLIESSRSF